jgi:hypothetical protein
MPFETNESGWDTVVKKTIEEVAVPICQTIADACNKALEARGHPTHKEGDEPGYIVGIEGGKPLELHDYRATVITKTNEAMVDNAENNTLIYNFQQGAVSTE